MGELFLKFSWLSRLQVASVVGNIGYNFIQWSQFAL